MPGAQHLPVSERTWLGAARCTVPLHLFLFWNMSCVASLALRFVLRDGAEILRLKIEGSLE